ncbi:MAG TPA: hydrogenase maturation nickel metallochaperone HypA [Bacteroidales bacterium]|nr:hydrogenase maturation nickel metallochaperone HypA [Bacteroidales bacterium]
MHEFSLVENIIEIVTETAERNGLTTVESVELEVGAASGVIREAMEFAWEAAVKGSAFERTRLIIKEIPLIVSCSVCGKEYSPVEIYESCPGCGDVSPKVLSGKELRVAAIEGSSK